MVTANMNIFGFYKNVKCSQGDTFANHNQNGPGINKTYQL